jgi:hypothetical protein
MTTDIQNRALESVQAQQTYSQRYSVEDKVSSANGFVRE